MLPRFDEIEVDATELHLLQCLVLEPNSVRMIVRAANRGSKGGRMAKDVIDHAIVLLYFTKFGLHRVTE